MELPVLWSGLISFIHVLGEIANGLIASPIDPLLVNLNMLIENAPYKFIIIITINSVCSRT